MKRNNRITEPRYENMFPEEGDYSYPDFLMMMGVIITFAFIVFGLIVLVIIL